MALPQELGGGEEESGQIASGGLEDRLEQLVERSFLDKFKIELELIPEVTVTTEPTEITLAQRQANWQVIFDRQADQEAIDVAAEGQRRTAQQQHRIVFWDEALAKQDEYQVPLDHTRRTKPLPPLAAPPRLGGLVEPIPKEQVDSLYDSHHPKKPTRSERLQRAVRATSALFKRPA